MKGGEIVEKLYKAGDISEILRIPKANVYRLTRNGSIPVVKVGRYYRYCLEDVIRTLSEEVR